MVWRRKGEDVVRADESESSTAFPAGPGMSGSGSKASGFSSEETAASSLGEKEKQGWVDTGIDMDAALTEERRFIEGRLQQRGLQESGDVPFSVAFSGGGVRAAAFQAGVLWRLAEGGHLGRIEHLVAVSGGAYIACGFASHLVSAERPGAGMALDRWYLFVVAKTLCRMQRNIGYMVRDWREGPFKIQADGSGLLPPVCDGLVLAAVILFTLLSNPVTHFVVYIVPLTECLNQFMGMTMRAAYCAPDTATAWAIFEWWGPMRNWIIKWFYLLVFTFGAWLLGKIPGCRQPGSAKDFEKKKERHRRRRCSCPLAYLYLQSLRAAATRIVVVYALIIVALTVILGTEMWAGKRFGHRRLDCARFIEHEAGLLQCDDIRTDTTGQDIAWYKDPLFDFYRNASLVAELEVAAQASLTTARVTEGADSSSMVDIFSWPFSQKSLFKGSSLFVTMVVFLLLLLGVALVLTPIFKGLFIVCLSLVGPAVAVIIAASFVQYRIFGPLTGQYYIEVLKLWPYEREGYTRFLLASLVLAWIMMVFFHTIHFTSHYYYTRSLRKSYFDQGRDVTWQELRRDPFCPFMLLTGTVTDWKKPGDHSGISEISISCLHTGSNKTGYVSTPPWRSVAKCMAVAAAATDAFILGMFDHLRFRFWFEFLNLRMGDYLLFERRRNPCVAWCQKRMPSCRRESFFFYEFPVVALGGCAFVIFIAASLWAQSDRPDSCASAKNLYVTSLYIAVSVFTLSFFAFVPCLEFFVHSPMIRQIHMAMRYYHISETPPSMVYVSDGGVQDCTGVLQLMYRRCARILLALVSADPEDDFTVFHTMMGIAAEQKLGSFYDPKDPRRDVNLTLEEFKNDLTRTHLHLGICYGWSRGEPEPVGGVRRQTGHLLIVKNRLPPGWEDMLVEAPLTEAEINRSGDPKTRARDGRAFAGGHAADSGMAHAQGTPSPRGASSPRGTASPRSQGAPSPRSVATYGVRRRGERVQQRHLGGCCCTFCHGTGCNVGPKFPHVANANQFLTPALFSSLCRLGYRLSEEAIDKIGRPDGLEEPWEKVLR